MVDASIHLILRTMLSHTCLTCYKILKNPFLLQNAACSLLILAPFYLFSFICVSKNVKTMEANTILEKITDQKPDKAAFFLFSLFTVGRFEKCIAFPSSGSSSILPAYLLLKIYAKCKGGGILWKSL